MLQSQIASSNHTNVCSPVYVWAGRGFVCIWTLTKDIPSSSLLFLDCDGGISRVDGPHTSLTHTSLAAVIRLCTLSVFLPSFHSVCPFPSLFLSWHLSALGISITWPPCFRAFFCIIVSLYYPSLSLPSPPFHSKLTPPHSEFLNLYSCLFPYIFVPPPLSFNLLFMQSMKHFPEWLLLKCFVYVLSSRFISICSSHFSYFCSLMHPVSLCLDDYKSELREQLPLIAGSAAAGVVFIVSLVAISIVCSRWVGHYGTRRMTAAEVYLLF